MRMDHYFIWIVSSVALTATDRGCSIVRLAEMDIYTNITLDRDKCEALVTTNPGNRIIALIGDINSVQVYDGNSTVLTPRFYSRYFSSTVSQDSELIMRGENSYILNTIFLISTGGSSCGYNFTVKDHDIVVELKGDKCTLFAETSPSNNIVAVSRISDFLYRHSFPFEIYPVLLFYDGNSTDEVPYVIPPDTSFASRGNRIAIECIHDCEDIYIALHRIAPRQILDIEVRSTGQIETPRYPLFDGESPFNLQLIWVLLSVRRATFTLEFLKFSLPLSLQKCLDILKIESSDGFTKEFCGDLATQLKYHLTSNKVTIMYTKNSHFPSNGFILMYKVCFTKIEEAGGMVMVPEHNISVRCVYKIEVDRGNIIEMNITGIDEMETRDFKRPCYIQIHDGVPPSLELSKINCSNNRPIKVVSTSNILYITYFGQGNPERKTVIARYSFTSAFYTKLNDTGGLIIVPAHNGLARCIYKIEVETGNIIELNMTGIGRNVRRGLNCPWRIHIHDGDLPSAALFTLSCSNDGPVKVESTSNVVYIVYSGQSNPKRSTFIARYIYKSAYRKYFWGEAGIIFLPESEVEKTKECQFFVSVSEMKKIRLYFHSKDSRSDDDTCSSVINVMDGHSFSSILYSGCVFSKLPEFVETTSNTMTIIVFLNDPLNTSRALGFYTLYEETTLPIIQIIIASLGLIILFLTGNISVWVWMVEKNKTSGRSTLSQRDIVFDNNTVYNTQEEDTENPYDEIE